MSTFKSLEEIFSQAEGKDYALVKDNTIYYLVLNRFNNTFTFDFMKFMNAIIDEIEAEEAKPACLVTIGTGEMIFSLGFDLKEWMKGVIPTW